jgi:hypothetical protein
LDPLSDLHLYKYYNWADEQAFGACRLLLLLLPGHALRLSRCARGI